ncbi:MAG: GFA family protein, partial [Actinomycetota bacterium]|nr:GFA family protein [Actinomycetota bacterium]
GSGKATIIVIPEKNLQTKGELKYYSVVGTDGATIERGFCEKCGSPIISAAIGPKDWEGIKFIKAGSLDDSSWVEVTANIWKSSARDWSPVSEELPTFDQNLRA